MSDTVWLAILGIVAMAVKEWFDQRRAKAVASEIVIVKTKVEAVPAIAENVAILEKSMNSMKTAQVEMAGKLGTAQGELKGRAELKAETKADDEAKPPAAVESVKAIINEYKAGELKQDVKEVKEGVDATLTVVKEIEKDKGK